MNIKSLWVFNTVISDTVFTWYVLLTKPGFYEVKTIQCVVFNFFNFTVGHSSQLGFSRTWILILYRLSANSLRDVGFIRGTISRSGTFTSPYITLPISTLWTIFSPHASHSLYISIFLYLLMIIYQLWSSGTFNLYI